jgi:hypothetical protein
MAAKSNLPIGACLFVLFASFAVDFSFPKMLGSQAPRLMDK